MCVRGGRPPYTHQPLGVRVSARGGTERSWLKPRTRRGGLSQPLSQCKHVLIEIRSSGYNSFADVPARPPFAYPPPPPAALINDVCSRCSPSPVPPIVTPGQKFDKFEGFHGGRLPERGFHPAGGCGGCCKGGFHLISLDFVGAGFR